MRTVKQFTPALLDRFRAEARGLGTYADYVPWHRVTRGEPSSRGRSHLLFWRGRHRELLSDIEWVTLCFAVLIPTLGDLREQFPLTLETADHEIAAYDARFTGHLRPGTLELADALKVRHPVVSDDGVTAPWVMSTDFLLTLKSASGRPELLAVACKSAGDVLRRRTREKLRLEREYWRARGVPWLLITPDLFDTSAGLTLRMATSWLLADQVPPESRHIAIDVTTHRAGRPLMSILNSIASRLGDMHHAQAAFWQAVWGGELPVDLRRGWRPQEPLELLGQQAFVTLNPLASRRSAWTD